MSVFITGATGFIGSHLAKELSERGSEVVILSRDYIPSKWLDEALSKCIVVKGDVRNLKLIKRILNEYGTQQVYHLAAQAMVKIANQSPTETFDVNVMGTVNIIEACRDCEVKKTLIQSTDKVYGEGLDKTVENSLAPVEIYGMSKACADLIAQNFTKVYGMQIIIARPCNAYGYDRNSRIIPNTIRACLRGEKPIIWKMENTLRQYIFVEDLVEALIFLMENKESGIYNIATPDILTPEEIVKTILKFFPHLEPKYIEREQPTEICQQSMKMNPFGWGPKWTFEKGIEETIKRFRKYGVKKILEEWSEEDKEKIVKRLKELGY